MTIQTKQQKRAEFALKSVQKIMDKNNQCVPEKLATKIVGMPNMILSNGFGQTLAFLLSKKGNETETEEEIIFHILKNWFQTDSSLAANAMTEMAFLESIIALPCNKYIEAQNEALRMLEWLKRYARAFSK